MNQAGKAPDDGPGGRVGDAPGQAAARAVSGQTRAARDVVAESHRLVVSVELAVSGLSAIGNSARQQSRFSARARVLELELLPAVHHLGRCVVVMHRNLLTSRAARKWTPQVATRAEEIRALLDRMMEIVTSVDIPGELGLPLELVSTAQAGVLDGLSCLDRLQEMLERAVDHQQVEFSPVAPEVQPAATAQWLVRTAIQLLPPAVRGRYAEEFAAELYALADARAGWRTQLGHAVREVAVMPALRCTLSSTSILPRPASPDVDRSRDTVDTSHSTVRRIRRRHLLREPLGWWLARRQALSILREERQAQAEYEELLAKLFSERPFPGGQGRHRRRRDDKRNDTD